MPAVCLSPTHQHEFGFRVGDVDRSLPLGVPDRWVGPVLQKQDAHVGLALDTGLVKRCVVPTVRGVGLGASLSKELGKLCLASSGKSSNI